jgi:exosortase/archaeosortase family protein
VFSLPGITIEVAEECSGIRSSLILLIMSLLAGHLYLRSAWTKTLLSAATLPLGIVKNGIRIVTLTLLSIYIDPSFLTGQLHQKGGIVFFLLALVILAPVLWLLQRLERMEQNCSNAVDGAVAGRLGVGASSRPLHPRGDGDVGPECN